MLQLPSAPNCWQLLIRASEPPILVPSTPSVCLTSRHDPLAWPLSPLPTQTWTDRPLLYCCGFRTLAEYRQWADTNGTEGYVYGYRRVSPGCSPHFSLNDAPANNALRSKAPEGPDTTTPAAIGPLRHEPLHSRFTAP